MFRTALVILSVVLFLVALILVLIPSGIEPKLVTGLMLGGLASGFASFLPIP